MEVEEATENIRDWPITTMAWYAVLVWFSSSVLSQVAHIAVYGIPYSANSLLLALGPMYWIVVFIEVVMWAVVASLVLLKVTSRKQNTVNPAT